MSSQIPAGAVALVTGCSSGFGLLASVELARRGLRVVATMRDLGRADALDAAMAAAGTRCDKVRLDVTDSASIAAAIAEVEGSLGPVEVLVNNAGFGLAGFVEDLTMAELREQFETNFFGLVELTKAVIGGMRERGRGRIINVSSIAGRAANPAFGAYSASKYAVEGLSESLRHELLPYGVYVTLVEPGTFRTEIFERNRRVGAHAYGEQSPYWPTVRRIEQIVDAGVEKSTADPGDVARVIAHAATARRPRLRYLVGRDARAINALKTLLPFEVYERIVQRMIEPRD